MPIKLTCLARSISLAVVAALSAGAETTGTNSAWLARTWQFDDGLPGNIVSGVAQTPNGYLWVATENGVARFDGVRFRPIVVPRLPGRRSSIIRVMLLAGHDLWLGMDGGLAARLEQGATNAVVCSQALPNSQPVDIAEDRDHAIWISFLNRTVCRIAGGDVAVFGSADGLTGNTPCALASDAAGQLWFAQSGRVGVFRDGRLRTLQTLAQSSMRIAPCRSGGIWICAGMQVYKFREGNEPEAIGQIEPERPGAAPAALLEDRSGALWIGTSTSGLYRYEGGHFERVKTSHLEILSLMEDREGDLWVGTGGGGLNRLRPRVLELQGTEAGLPFESVVSVCEDATGGLWTVTQDGVLARSQSAMWTAVTDSAGWPGGIATCLAPDHNGGVWIGTRNRGLCHWKDGKFTTLTRRDGLAGDNIRALLVSGSGDLWIGLDARPGVDRLRDGKLELFDLPNSGRPVRAMAEDAHGNVWLGTVDGLLFRWNGDRMTDETPAAPSPVPAIRCLHATYDGSVWIGYSGAGIGRWKDGHYARVAGTQGLLDGHISQIVADDQGALWLASNHGIFEVSRSGLDDVMAGRSAHVRSIIYGRDEGLANLQPNFGYSPGGMRSRDGRIWFVTRTGLAIVHAKNVCDNSLPPPVVIEDMVVDGRTIDQPEANGGITKAGNALLELSPKHRKVDFDYTALSFVAPENVHFRYRLEGAEDEWVEAGPRRSASYQHLVAGEYRFHVQACNNTGIWNETGAALAFAVRPFFWQTWWFRIPVVAAFSFSLVAIVRYASFRRLRGQLRLLEQQAALHKERARIAKDMHDDLGASLTQIALLSELAQQDLSAPQKAGDHIQKISGTARQVIKSLDEIVWAVNPRNDTLAHLIDYVGQSSLDFLRAPGIRCRLDLPENPPARTVPTEVRHNLFLVIKEALHNIVKHAHATEVWLRVDATSKALRITIDDNGCGFEKRSENSWADGLRNMRQRMTEVGGEFRIESQSGAGTKVILELPWPA